MNQASLDELERKKQLQNLNLDDVNSFIGKNANTDEYGKINLESPMRMEPIDVPGEIASPKQAEIPSPQPIIKDESTPFYKDKVVADIIAGATPTLLSFLTGAAPSVVNMQADKGNSFIQNRAKQEIPTKDNTTVIDNNGVPEIAMYADSLGKKSWQKSGKGGDAAGSYQFSQIYDPTTETYNSVKYNTRNGSVLNLDGSPYNGSSSSIIRPGKEVIINSPTIGGGKNIDKFNQYQPQGNQITRVVTAPGRGDLSGGITKEEYDATIKGAEKGRDQSFETQKALGEIQSMTNNPDTLKNPVVFSTNFGALLRQAVGEKRLSDDEQDKYEGGKYKSLFQVGYNILDGKFQGEIPQNVIDDYLALRASTKLKLESNLRSIQRAYVNPGVANSKSQRDAQIRASGQDPQDLIKRSAQDKAEMIMFEKEAAKFYGKGSEKYNKAMEFKRQRMGL